MSFPLTLSSSPSLSAFLSPSPSSRSFSSPSPSDDVSRRCGAFSDTAETGQLSLESRTNRERKRSSAAAVGPQVSCEPIPYTFALGLGCLFVCLFFSEVKMLPLYCRMYPRKSLIKPFFVDCCEIEQGSLHNVSNPGDYPRFLMGLQFDSAGNKTRRSRPVGPWLSHPQTR